MRESLVVVQFGVAIAFAVAAAIILSQTRYLRQADLGFDRHNLIVSKSYESPEITDSQRASLLEAWRALPGVTAATAGDIGPGDNDSTWNNNTRRAGTPAPGPGIFYVRAAPDFFRTYGVQLRAGRLPDRVHSADFASNLSATTPSPQTSNVVLNSAAVKALGFRSERAALEQDLIGNLGPGADQRLQVIGVVKDVRFRSPREPVPPTIYLSYSGAFAQTSASVRYAGIDAKTALAEMGTAWGRIAPSVPFEAARSENSLARYYRPDDQHGRLFTLGAILAVAIGCVGLYGLASFNTARRVKEIGIRKALGASTGDVLRLLVGQLLRPVLLANLLAWPLAYLAMRSWLNGFDQRIGLSPLYFLGASALMLAVALLTVVGQALAVARAEPARALRHD